MSIKGKKVWIFVGHNFKQVILGQRSIKDFRPITDTTDDSIRAFLKANDLKGVKGPGGFAGGRTDGTI